MKKRASGQNTGCPFFCMKGCLDGNLETAAIHAEDIDACGEAAQVNDSRGGRSHFGSLKIVDCS